MNTYFIGREEVAAYAEDLLERLQRLETFPQVWCPITSSGDAIQEVLIELARAKYPDLIKGLISVPIGIVRPKDGNTASITFPEQTDLAAKFSGKSVLFLDGAIHSGTTMNLSAAEVLKHKPKELISYSLVMKIGSSFVPTFWAVTMAETDRAFFLLDRIPHNRLDAGHKRKQPPVHLERLSERHLGKPLVLSDVPSMDRVTWSDRLFQMKIADNPPCTYLLCLGDSIVGFLTIHHASNTVLSIDEVVVEKSLREGGYGGILLRFADTVGRQTDCTALQLLGIDAATEKYQTLGYRKIDGKKPIPLDGELYWPMERELLYHQRHR